MNEPMPKTVQDIMTRRLVTLFETENLTLVEAGMQRFRFRHLPVIDNDGKLVGILTQRDLLRVSASSLDPNGDDRNREIRQRLTVAAIMTRHVRTVDPGMSLVDAGRLMRDQKLGCLPVVAADNSLIGLVTEADFVSLAIRLLEDNAS